MTKFQIQKLLLSLAIICFSVVSAFSQGGNVTGTITDATDGATLPGASVVIEGTTLGTVTDINGNYSIDVSLNTTLVFSFLGFETREIIVQPSTIVDVALTPKVTRLNELIIVGYGVQKKKDATGSITAVNSDEFNTGAITSPTELVMGKIAGVQITTGGGAPGSEATIRIRGGSSLSANNDPLYVIDGVPVSSSGISGMRNPLNTINPNDIETFTVLKDASAAAIYGSRASNGVIIITTKKAKLGGKALKLNYSGNFSFSTPTKKIDVLGADDFRNLVAEKYPSQVSMLGDANTVWQDEIFENAIGMDHHLSLMGAVKNIPFRVSMGHSNNDGILKSDNIKRTTIGTSINPVFLDNHLKVNINAKYMNVDNRFADRGAIGGAIQFDPTKPILSGDTAYGGYYAWLQNSGNPVTQATTNPVALLNLREDLSNVDRFIGNAQIDYKMHFLPELRANLNVGYDYSKAEGTVYVPEYAAWSYDDATGGGTNNMYEQEKKNELLELYLNYSKELKSIDSKIDLMAGYSWQHFWRKNYSINSDVANTPSKTDTISDPTEYYLVSFFGRLNYNLMDRYLLTASLRQDGSSHFSEDNQWGFFPAVAIAWNAINEPFMKNVKTFSQLKLRLGWGITGQQNILDNDYPYLPRYTSSQVNAQYQLGNLYYTTLRPEGYDANLKWEETTTYNIGLDYGFAKDRFHGTLDFYFRETNDLLNFIPVPAGTNLTNIILTNVGDLENKGAEFSIITRPVVKKDLVWEIGFNATYNENKITRLIASDDPTYPGSPTGGISGGVGNYIQMNSVGYSTNSFFVFEQIYDAEGMPIQGMYVDRSGDGEITTADKYHYKKPAADFFFGISSNVQYKNWNFSFSGRANFGNYVYNNVASENGVYERLYRPEGPYLGNVASYVYDTDFDNPQYLSDYYIEDASFFRMDNIKLSYIFKDIINGNADLSLSATVNNAFVITKYQGLDPELTGGLDNNIYPRPRIYVFGVNLQF